MGADDFLTDAGASLTSAGGFLANAGGLLTGAGGSLADAGGYLTVAGGYLIGTGVSLTSAGGLLIDAGASLTSAGGYSTHAEAASRLQLPILHMEVVISRVAMTFSRPERGIRRLMSFHDKFTPWRVGKGATNVSTPKTASNS